MTSQEKNCLFLIRKKVMFSCWKEKNNLLVLNGPPLIPCGQASVWSVCRYELSLSARRPRVLMLIWRSVVISDAPINVTCMCHAFPAWSNSETAVEYCLLFEGLAKAKSNDTFTAQALFTAHCSRLSYQTR